METEQLPDPFTAAENYRRSRELAEQAREQLIASTIANRQGLNVRALSRRAGIYEGTLHKWMQRKELADATP
jgi:lambda repressor-like predicted transcriptional regulator